MTDEGSKDFDPTTLNGQVASCVGAGGSASPLTQSQLITLADGTQMYADPGWNELPNGRRVYLRKDLTASETAGPNWRPPDAKAMVAGNQAQDPGSARQPNPGAYTFEQNNELSTRHGAWSPRRVDPIAAQLVETAVTAVSWLADPTYGPALFAWARAEARCQLVGEYLDEFGPLDEKGEPRGALGAADRLESLALKHRTRLGLDPVSRAQLEATLTGARQGQFALEEAMERGAKALEARRAATGLTWSPQDSPNPLGGETTRPQPPASPVDPRRDPTAGPNQ